MSDKYKARDPNEVYFITMTVVGWIDIFTRPNQKVAIVESLKYSIENKGLEVFAWVLMSSHLHMVCRCNNEDGIQSWLRDFKKFTSKKIIELVNKEPESRRKWLLTSFKEACAHLKRNQNYKVWQSGNYCIEIYDHEMLMQKIDYIHQNPVKSMIVEKPEDYIFSSACDYAEIPGLVPVEVCY
jgi:REP element-mobilizing transposase RayT